MKLFSQDVVTLHSLYVLNLKRALDVERQAVEILSNLVGRTQDEPLTTLLLAHLEESRIHASKVEAMLIRLVSVVEPVTSEAMASIAIEASDVLADMTDPAVVNIALIGVAQQMEHHEIAVYGTLRRWALLLGLVHDARILEVIEAEEINADEQLSEIAERVNLETAA
jgi:ferritin-like metal-binding protein YciE